MKRLICLILTVTLLFCGCAPIESQPQVVATTLPVFEFTTILCQDTGIRVSRLIDQQVSCLHDYSMQVDETRMLEAAEIVICSGAGLDDFVTELVREDQVLVDASAGIEQHCAEESGHVHEHGDHHHDTDPHIWLSIPKARHMAENICTGLIACYPGQKDTILSNMDQLTKQFDALQAYGEQQLADIRHREIITFHDGFSYLAEDWDIVILKAVEEESGSEASAGELIEIIGMVREHQLPAVFTEANGSTAAAEIISRETGIDIYTLDMAMSGESWFQAMRNNFDVLKEALE